MKTVFAERKDINIKMMKGAEEKHGMNTEKFINLEKSVSIQAHMSEEHRDLCCKYILISQYIKNIKQLFLIFQVNLDQLEEYCILYYNDQAEPRNAVEKVDLIKLNALTVNIVSAGKSLVEMIEILTTKYITDEKMDFKKELISKKYDESFSYRFMYFIRNFAQHGHLPVSLDEEGKLFFDLYEILDTPDFEAKSFGGELEKYKQRMIKQFGTRPHLAYVYTMDEYVRIVYEIYEAYYEYIRKAVKELDEAVYTCLQEHPEYIVREPEEMAGLVPVYMDHEEVLHVFCPEERMIFLFETCMEEARQALLQYVQKNKKVKLKLVYCLENKAALLTTLSQEDFEENLYEYCMRAAPDAGFVSFEKDYGKSELMALGKMYPYIYRNGHIIWNVPYEEVTIGDFINTFPEVREYGIEVYLNNVGGAGELFEFLEQGWVFFINTAQDLIAFMEDSHITGVLDWMGRAKLVYDVFQFFRKSFGKQQSGKPRVSEFQQFLQKKNEWNIDELCEILEIEKELAVLSLKRLGFVTEDGVLYILDESRHQMITQYETDYYAYLNDRHGTDVNCYSMNQEVENINLDLLYYAVLFMEQDKLEQMERIVMPVKEMIGEFQGILEWDDLAYSIKISKILPDTFCNETEEAVWHRLLELEETLKKE